jgi:hypothetical protein
MPEDLMRLVNIVIAALAALVVAAAGAAAQSFSFERLRNDLFAGAAGDMTALRRVLTEVEGLLAANPQHPQAMVVHGIAVVFAAAHESAGEPGRAAEMFQRGITEVNAAVTLAPDDLFVRVLRGVLLQRASGNVPPPLRAQMLEDARSDFQRVFDMQQSGLDGLGTHRLGELLSALGDVYSRLDRTGEAERYYSAIVEKLPGTEYARRAADWMATRTPLPAERTTCIGCHVETR